MSQQINLFNPVFLKKEKYFSAITMMQGLGLILLGAIVMVVYVRLQLSSLSAEASATAAQLTSTKAQLAKINVEYAPRQKSKSMEDEVRRMESEVKSQQQAFDVVQKGGLGNTQGYSEYLRAFSRQIVNGLWLTGFSIHGAGNAIEIRGRALQPELVPTYITRLKQEEIMKGKSFETLVMTIPEGATDSNNGSNTGAAGKRSALASYIEFVLQSEGIGNKADVFSSHAPQPMGTAEDSTGAGAK